MKTPFVYLICFVLIAGAWVREKTMAILRRKPGNDLSDHEINTNADVSRTDFAERKHTERRLHYFLMAVHKMATQTLDFLRVTPHRISIKEFYDSFVFNVRTHLNSQQTANFGVGEEKGDLGLVHRFAEHRSDSFPVQVEGWKEPVYVRPKTSDIGVLSQVVCTKMFSSLETPEYSGLDRNAELNIVDAGANVGYSSICFHHLFPKARIVSLEPESGNFGMLKHNTERLPKITPLEKGLWPRSSRLKVVRMEQGEEWGTQVIESIGEDWDVDGINVPDLMNSQGMEKIDLFKIDIEGSELELFSDTQAQSWLRKSRLLCLELHGKECNEAVFGALAPFEVEKVWYQDDIMFVRLAA